MRNLSVVPRCHVCNLRIAHGPATPSTKFPLRPPKTPRPLNRFDMAIAASEAKSNQTA